MPRDGADDGSREQTMTTLIMFVARAFYDTRYVVVLDQLARHEVLKDDELASRVGLNGKDLGKLTTKLVADGLVTVFRQNTSRTGETMSRVTSKGYYYVDHASFCNVVKWRISAMMKQIDNKLRNELAQQGFVCPQCGKEFQTLDIMHLSRNGGLFCDQCDTELVNNQNEDDVAGNEHRMQRFNSQTQRIRDGLKRTEGMVMPKVDILDWIRRHPTIVPNVEGELPKKDDLAIAGAKSITQKQVYDVVLTTDDSGEMERIAREKEASARKQQNAMPLWHTRSTVTGDLTAFGLKTMDSSGEDGVDTADARNARLLEDHEDQKNSIEMYYADLEARDRASQAQSPMEVDRQPYDESGASRPGASASSSARNSTLAVPSSIDGAMSRTYSVSSLKRKLNESAMDDLTGNRSKHSRSTSYQSTPPSQAATPIRSKSRESDEGSSTSEDNGTWQRRLNGGPNGLHTVLETSNGTFIGRSHFEAAKGPADPMVSVAGAMVPLSQVTDEHHDIMTPDEYERYAELLMAGG